ncbi:MAG: diphthamide synthesis protein [bacterium]
MKKLFIPTEYKLELDKSKIKKTLNKLPSNLIIFYTSQYKEIAKEIKNILKNKNIIQFQQVLGCSKINQNKKAKAILFIGSGNFHSIGILLNTNILVYTYYPEKNFLKKITKEQSEKLRKKQKASYMNYLNSEKIGFLISIKPGQNKLEKAISLKNKIKNKKTYLFLGNNFNISEFENFSIDSWINTACPRLDINSNKIINYQNLCF